MTNLLSPVFECKSHLPKRLPRWGVTGRMSPLRPWRRPECKACAGRIHAETDLDHTETPSETPANRSLTTVIASTQEVRALPDKEKVAPNQKSWTETAKRMGVKRGPKKRLPKEHGQMERIGASKGKCACIHTDLYAGGERSGKHAKPDA